MVCVPAARTVGSQRASTRHLSDPDVGTPDAPEVKAVSLVERSQLAEKASEVTDEMSSQVYSNVASGRARPSPPLGLCGSISSAAQTKLTCLVLACFLP